MRGLLTFLLWCTVAGPVLAVEPYVMPDGSISWKQPDSTGVLGYEGRCGQTAAANIISMLSTQMSPDDVVDVCYDTTPGSRPSTLADFLSQQLNQIWEVEHLAPEQALDHLASAVYGSRKTRVPVAVLVKVEGLKQYHWVTVIRVTYRDEVVYNEHGTQRYESWEKFSQKWQFDGDGPRWLRVMRPFGIRPFTMIRQVAIPHNNLVGL